MEFEINGEKWSVTPMHEMGDNYDDLVYINHDQRACVCNHKTLKKLKQSGPPFAAVESFLKRREANHV